MIKRLILKKQSFGQLGIAMFGALAGFGLLLSGYQIYLDVLKVLTTKHDMFGDQYLIINKTVSLLNTLSLSSNTFSEKEMRELKAVPGVKDVAPFTSNLFEASAMTNKEQSGMPIVNTDLFFEAVPDSFLDVKPEEWHWEEGDERVPIIIPADYIKLYNFGFAPSRGLPQFSKGMISLFNFKIRIQSKGKTYLYDANIVDFSERINSFLVPKSFLDYANEQYGETQKTKEPSRLIVVSKDPSNSDLIPYLDKKGYEANSEQIRNSKYAAFVKVLLVLVTTIGLIIIVLAMLGFVQYAQLVISKSSYEVRTLAQLGYYYTTIAQKYIFFYSILFVIITALAIPVVLFVRGWFVDYATAHGFEITGGIDSTIYLYGAGLMIAFMLLQSVAVLFQVRRLSRSGR